MTTDIAEQVREYAEYVDSIVPDWTVEGVLTSPVAEPQSEGPRRRWYSTSQRGVLAALGAAIVVLVVVTTPTSLTTTLPDGPTTVRQSIPWYGQTNVLDVEVGADGSLWATLGDGVVRWTPGSEIPEVYMNRETPNVEAYRITVAPDGDVWVGSMWQMARFDGSWTTFGPRDPDDALMRVLEQDGPEDPIAVDNDGVVWSAMGRHYLGRLDGWEYEFFSAPVQDSFGDLMGWATSIDVAPDGTVWVGSAWSNAVFAFDGTDWTTYTAADGLPGGVGWIVAVAPDGTVWAGAGADIPGSGRIAATMGVARFDGSEWMVYTTADGLLSNDAAVEIGPDGTVWAIQASGVSHFEDNTWVSYPDAPGLGFRAAVDASGTLWRPDTDGLVGFDGTNITRHVLPIDEPPTSPIPPSGAWDPILSTTSAKTAPPAATCPAGTDPAAPGPVDQERPDPRWVTNVAAAFDRHTGRIVYVDVRGATWTFDVCTNTWEFMNPEGAPYADRSDLLDARGQGSGVLGDLVYDADSDRTIAFGSVLAVYDANTNTWTQPRPDPANLATGRGPAVYDPVTGLIITTGDEGLLAYDVDTNTWTVIGPIIHEDLLVGDFLGYSPEIDRLIFVQPDHTRLIDPRTGESTLVVTDSPYINLVWPSEVHGSAADTVYVTQHWDGDLINFRICGFDTVNLAWTSCVDVPEDVEGQHYVFSAMVGDPINNRLVLINGGWGNSIDDVWSVDLDTGEWIQLVAASRGG